ncbi:MAG: response regulator [Alphaproteobacteria bacterium]|nr:response regulator [Alphaproteobacteria bacterium]
MGQLSRAVAIVDDDAAVRHALKFALESEGLNVRVHGRAPALLDDPELYRYGCLVIDYRMPDVDGLELVDALRRRGVSAPIIMITGRANAGMRERAGRAGIDTILEKPLSDSALSTAIHSALAAPPAAP